MKTLVFVNSIGNYSNPLIISPPNFLTHFPLHSPKNKTFLPFSRSKWFPDPKTLNLSPIKAITSPESLSYGGWEDLRLSDSVESTPLRDFLVSIGIDDRKYVFMFILGLLCAFSISRVRVSSIIVFPATVLVFAIGFSFGFVRGSSFSEAGASKRRSKEEIFRPNSENLRNLLDFFERFEGKVGNLKSGIRRAIDCNKVTVSDLEKFLSVVESINVSASNARNAVEACVVNLGSSNNVLHGNQKSSKKRKEIGDVGFDWLQFIGGLSGVKVVNSNPNRIKDNIKHENDQSQGNNSSPGDEQRFLSDDEGIGNLHFSQDSLNNFSLNQDRDRRIKVDLLDERMTLREMGAGAKEYMETDDYTYQNKRLQFTNKHRDSVNMGHTNERETRESGDNLLDSGGFRVSWNHMESEASFVQEHILRKSSGAFRSSHYREKDENQIYSSTLRENKVNPDDDSHLTDHLRAHEGEISSSSSSKFTDDVIFDRNLVEANDLLKQARECMRSGWDGERAEMILHKSARLLTQAIAMKPMSLLAVGQLGNTYLVHGELKLHFSRKLRRLLLEGDVISVEKQKRILKELDYQFVNKDKIASLLVDACEQCEELLVKAGRKYRSALSIDGNDVRALYNWGLALSFRAQLVADIGPEMAFDADKIFLAAIDKFDAMMSKGNIYAPDALFRWAVVLQQRSRLRPSNSKEKVKLLQQARRLYEDALHMNSDNLQVREALSSCMSELNYGDFF
ncbi:hypothetical protein AB3S75_008348 [Citrus x aurantiifolia]